MKFVIRDDDLNYFSAPADIERWYADVFAAKVPVGFATIPFVKGTSDVYTGGAPKDETEYPVSGNAELISYVRGNPLIEIVQHGSTHETVGGVYEYARKEGLEEATRRGKAELEGAFGKPVRVFAPPHDWIGTSGVLAVEAVGMDIIRGRGAGLRNWLPRFRYTMVFLFMLVYRFPRYISSAPRVYPRVLDFGRHKEACSYRLEDPDVFDGLKRAAAKKNGIFVVVVHLHFYTEEKKARLLALIDEARSLGAKFVKPGELFVR